MMERYYESFFTDEVEAQHELDLESVDYSDVGMYPCAGGFLVWAAKDSDRNL